MIKLFGIKLIMNQFFTLTGKTYANTLIKIGPCFIINKKFKEIDGYNAIQLGYNYCKDQVLNKSKLGYLQHQNIIPLTFLKEFLIENPNKFRIGQILDSSFFIENEYILIKNKTIGKGFCGVIKRYNFVKGPLTHGSKNHRQPGSIGQGTTPGRVFKGKKLSGNMGKKQRISVNLQILKINYLENILFIKGNFAGNFNSIITIYKNKFVNI